MRRSGAALFSVFLVLALVPEVARFRAERQLRAVTSAFQLVLGDAARVRDPGRVLAALDATAMHAASGLPGDSRARILAGSTRLVGGDFAGALARYREALALGERAEIALNIGRALHGHGDNTAAEQAFVRALWVSPALLDAVPDEAEPAVRDAVARAAALLATGRLASPPPLP
jgi:hypothetical protein